MKFVSLRGGLFIAILGMIGLFATVSFAQKDGNRPRLKSVKFDRDMTSAFLGWEWQDMVEGNYRVKISAVGAKGVSLKVFKGQTGSVPVIEAKFDGKRRTAVVGAKTYVLKKGKRVLPATVDPRAIWLLSQDYGTNRTLKLSEFNRSALAGLKARNVKVDLTQAKKIELKLQTIEANISLGEFWDYINQLADCVGSSDSCVEAEGLSATDTVTVHCVCGTATCMSQQVTFETYYYVFDTSTNELKVETIVSTKIECVCTCIEPPRITRTPVSH